MCKIKETSQSWRYYSLPGQSSLTIHHPYVRKYFLTILQSSNWLLCSLLTYKNKILLPFQNMLVSSKSASMCVYSFLKWLIFSSLFLKQPDFLLSIEDRINLTLEWKTRNSFRMIFHVNPVVTTIFRSILLQNSIFNCFLFVLGFYLFI